MPEEQIAPSEELVEPKLEVSVFDNIKPHKFKLVSGLLLAFAFIGVIFTGFQFTQLRQTQPKEPCPCPEFKSPDPDFCLGGTIIPGEIDECGCQMPPTCQRTEEVFICVDKESLNCAEEIELSFQCTEEYRNWAKENCSGWEESCFDNMTGEEMSLIEAKEIAEDSECFEEGSFKEEAFCNQYTGTWWIDLDIEKEGCAPACVINISTEEAEINWRCTGAIIP